MMAWTITAYVLVSVIGFAIGFLHGVSDDDNLGVLKRIEVLLPWVRIGDLLGRASSAALDWLSRPLLP